MSIDEDVFTVPDPIRALLQYVEELDDEADPDDLVYELTPKGLAAVRGRAAS